LWNPYKCFYARKTRSYNKKRLPPKTLKKLKEIAKTEERSLSNMISFLIEKYDND